MNLSTWKQTGNTYDHHGQPVFFREGGKGEALVLLHGFPTASWDWHKIWDSLAGQFRVIAMDFVGFGFSAKPAGYPYSILDQADMVEGLVKQLGIEKAHVMSHDYGDTVAQELLARHNEREASKSQGLTILSLCLLNGGLFPEVHKPKTVQKLLLSPIGPLLAPFMGKQKLKKTFHDIFGPDTPPTDQEVDEFWELLSRDGGKKRLPALLRYMPERVRYRERWVAALQEANIPLRMINGAMDPISGRHMADRYRELIPNPDVVVLDRIGHYPQTESPEEVVTHYFQFADAVLSGG